MQQGNMAYVERELIGIEMYLLHEPQQQVHFSHGPSE